MNTLSKLFTVVAFFAATTIAQAQPVRKPQAMEPTPVQTCGKYMVVDACSSNGGKQVFDAQTRQLEATFDCRNKDQCVAGMGVTRAGDCSIFRRKLAETCPALR